MVWQVTVTPLGVFGGWLSAAPAAGSVLPSSQSTILLTYDVSQNEFQGKNQAEVLLTTTARPVAKVPPPRPQTKARTVDAPKEAPAVNLVRQDIKLSAAAYTRVPCSNQHKAT